ncbi:MAG TPA: hypothetical protein PLN69_05300 [bacterium]|nr:hypothetical protein [bacterium]
MSTKPPVHELSIESNRWWLFWGVVLAILGILFFNLVGFPAALIQEPGGPELVNAGLYGDGRDAYEVDSNGEIVMKLEGDIEVDPEYVIEYTKKAVCLHHAQVINTLVELWYIQHDGEWPQDDLSDIGRDINYFPSGVPTCPDDNMAYRLDSVTHRVIGYNFIDMDSPLKGLEERDERLVVPD